MLLHNLLHHWIYHEYPRDLTSRLRLQVQDIYWDVSEVGRLNARRHESGNDYCRVIGDTLERIHVVPRDTLYAPENLELPVGCRRNLSSRKNFSEIWQFLFGVRRRLDFG